MNWSLVTNWIGEAVGVAILVGLIAFVITYRRNATWKSTRPGRAIMYQKWGWIASVSLLIIWSIIPEPPELRWIFELVVYTPACFAVWNMYFALVEQLEGKPNHVFKVNRKAASDELQSDLDEDTTPTHKE